MLEGFIQPGVPLPIFWTFCGLAIVIQGVSKSGFAGGAGILSLPLMMLVMPVDKVAATLLPLLILCDMNAIYHHWDNKDWSKIRPLFAPCIAGIVLGAGIWYVIGEAGVEQYGKYVKQFVGVIAALFAFYIVGREAALHWVEGYRPGRGATIFTGLSAGFCSTIAHAAGPIIGLYMFAQGMGKTLFVGTVAWTFTLINLAKLPFYIAVGLVHTDVLLFDLALVWLIPLGSALGKGMHHRVSERLFNRIILVLTLLAAIQLILDVNVVLWALKQIYPRE